jgi:UDP-N-acetylglucosamine:LPS N-acetylglucosamine transferase
VDDAKDDWQRTAGELLGKLRELMADDVKREEMARAARDMGQLDAAEKIAVFLGGS